jgi:membrane-associated PAP2 superfamily phosphatase
MFFKSAFSDFSVAGWGSAGFVVWTAFFLARAVLPRARTAGGAVAV